MMAVAFKPAEIDPHLSLVIFEVTFAVFVGILVVLFVQHLVSFLRTKRSEEEIKLFHEWCENGTAISNWLKTRYQELKLNHEATISKPEFQDLLRKDFEIYERLIILDPKLKEDPIANKGRAFYGSLVRTENQKPKFPPNLIFKNDKQI